MIQFRKAQKTDIERIWEIYLENHIEEEEGRAVIGWNRNTYPVKATAEEALLRDDLFVAEDETGVVGTAIINQEQVDVYCDGNWQYNVPNEQIMVLHTLVISSKVSGKGYAKQFVAFYEQYAKEHGCPYLRMDTNERNKRARTLYAKLGYCEIGIVPCVFHAMPDINMVLLEKKL